MPKKLQKGYIAFELTSAARSRLLAQFPPKFSDVIAHHITYEFGVSQDTALPEANLIQVVGHAQDDDGLEALVVSIDGTTTRPDGKTFHITWSLDRSAGFAPKDSSSVISEKGWARLPAAINISAQAKFF